MKEYFQTCLELKAPAILRYLNPQEKDEDPLQIDSVHSSLISNKLNLSHLFL